MIKKGDKRNKENFGKAPTSLVILSLGPHPLKDIGIRMATCSSLNHLPTNTIMAIKAFSNSKSYHSPIIDSNRI